MCRAEIEGEPSLEDTEQQTLAMFDYYTNCFEDDSDADPSDTFSDPEDAPGEGSSDGEEVGPVPCPTASSCPNPQLLWQCGI